MKIKISYKFFLGLILSLSGLYVAFNDFKFYAFYSIIQKVKIFYVILPCSLLILSVWFRAIRWNYLIKNKQLLKNSVLFEIQMVGFFGNQVLPLRLGELYKSILLSKRYKISKSQVIGSVILERSLDMIGLVFLSALLFFYPINHQIQKFLILSLFFVVILSFIFFMLKPILLKKQKLDFLNYFFKGVYGFEKENRIIIILITIVIWLIFLLNVFLIQHSLELELNFYECLLILLVGTFSIAIPAAPGMIGTFHLAVIYTSKNLLDLNSDLANAFAIILHAYGFLTFIIIGLIYFLKHQAYDFSLTDVD